MSITLTPEQAALIARWIEAGYVRDEADAVAEGLAALERHFEEKLAALRAAIKVGDDDIAAGRYKRFNSFEELDAHLDALTKSVLAERVE